jgi:hypothetical protein
LTLDYSDAPEPGAEQFFHYIISLHSPPKLITGRSPYSVDEEREIAFDEIPSDVIRDVCSFLESNIIVAAERQDKSLSRTLAGYLEAFSR